VAQRLFQRSSTLVQEMQRFSFYGRICAMKGLLQALPKDLLCAQLHGSLSASRSDTQLDHYSSLSSLTVANNERHSVCDETMVSHAARTDAPVSSAAHQAESTPPLDSSKASHVQHMDTQIDDTVPQPASTDGASSRQADQGSSQHSDLGSSDAQQDAASRPVDRADNGRETWLLISDAALPACCAAVQQSTDTHHKFHAVSALAYCLDRIKQCLQVWALSFAVHYKSLTRQQLSALISHYVLAWLGAVFIHHIAHS